MKTKLSLFILLILVISCASQKTTENNFDDSIKEKYWKLKTIDGKIVEMKANQEREIYFILKNDGSMKGFAGCNQFQGKYLINKNKITYSNIALTMQYCDTINDQEFLKILNKTEKYIQKKDALTLYQSGKASATFEAIYF